LDRPLWRCPSCHSHLNLTPGPGIGSADIDSGCRSLWRYRAALPIGDLPRVTLGEGATPLIEGEWCGRRVRFKLEFLAPSGSFKDRGVAVMLNYLLRHGVTAMAEDSSGNGGASLAAYAAAASLPCRILVPAATSPAKIIQIAATGAEVVRIEGSRQDVADAALREAEITFYASHNWQPLFLEGTKTLGYELWEDLRFRVPDNIVVPVGGGSNLLGCHYAFSELRRRGEVDRLPRLFAVQAARCAPLHAAFQAGGTGPVATPTGRTVAEGIAIARPVRLREVMEALRACHGKAVAVTEEEILAALAGLAKIGLFVEPTSAAAAAGLARLLEQGDIEAGQTTVLVLTGSGLKATEVIGKALGIAANR
jgi:threonine synthase